MRILPRKRGGHSLLREPPAAEELRHREHRQRVREERARAGALGALDRGAGMGDGAGEVAHARAAKCEVEMDLGTEVLVVAGSIKRLGGELGHAWEAAAAAVDLPQHLQSLRAQSPRRRLVHRGLEQRLGAAQIAGVEVQSRRRHQPLHPAPAVAGRRETQSQLHQLGGRIRRASGARQFGRRVELARDPLVRTRGSERQVAGTLLLLAHQRGEVAVDTAARGVARPAVNNRGEDRVRELDPAGVDAHHARLLGRREEFGVDQLNRGLGQRRRREQRAARARGEAVDARLHERGDAGRDRHLSIHRRPAPELASDLERVERIAPAHAGDLHEQRSREGAAGVQLDQLVQRRNRHGPDLDRGLRERREAGGCARPQREQEPRAFGRQAPEDETEHAFAGRIEPVGVIDRDEERALARHVPHQREDGRAHRPFVDPLGRGGHLDQRGGERLALGRRERRQRPIAQRRQQIAQRGKRQARLGLHRARCQHRRARSARSRHALLPDRRLTDPGLPAQHCRGGPPGEARDEALELRELGIPADNPGG